MKTSQGKSMQMLAMEKEIDFHVVARSGECTELFDN
jgi:hypothetical protein